MLVIATRNTLVIVIARPLIHYVRRRLDLRKTARRFGDWEGYEEGSETSGWGRASRPVLHITATWRTDDTYAVQLSCEYALRPGIQARLHES